MRAGICTIQLQALSIEAETTVKQAIGLARRRGHSHVTPLHVATAMLASSSGVLRRACLHCHSHPLQCKALELCFNVALNRLPTSTPNPLFGPQYPNPCLSNALVAAFKRAQAHQRRGSIENQQQQQPILALKIELEQLVISILDDPSVSRVMREAGFSSTQVKNMVEKAVSFEDYNHEKHYFYEKKLSNLLPSKPISHTHFTKPLLSNTIPNEELTQILEELSRTQRKSTNTVIVGENLSSIEGIIRGIMERFEKGEVPNELKFFEFLSLPLFSLRNLSKEEIEQKLLELKCIVKSCLGKRVIFYLGDLKWVSEFWSNYEEKTSFCSPVEQIIMEIQRLLLHGNNGESYGKFRVLGIATFQIYMRCKAGNPSLESLWSLQPLTVPVGSLSLSLKFESKECNFQTNSVKGFTLCREQYKDEAKKTAVIATQQDDQYEEWNNHKGINFLEKSFNFSPTSDLICHSFLGPKPSPKEYQFWGSDESDRNIIVSKPELLSNPNSSPNSASSSEVLIEEEEEEQQQQHSKLLSNSLMKTIPNCSKDKANELSAIILHCRSLRRSKKQESCSLLFMGNEEQRQAKERTARELAKILFGSQTKFISIGLSSYKQEIDEHYEQKNIKKRGRNELGCNYLQRFGEAINENPHRVFFMEDIEEIDYCSSKGLKEAIERGRVKLSNEEICSLKDAIIIINAQRQSVKQEHEEHEEHEERRFVSLDLNIAIQEGNGDRIRSILECVDRKILFS
ncbi:protein SMAX1-LIKE 3-like [Cucurbita maxima]|uniref:Protein SMAX1-LIKE 3-like n=1 Tax=Cucurbita maxima TaxID=3661 RepID=A0A6J1JSQ8_CUCMA|nr:protein SMAX1-LIKE 3-like [Cucurbita maxima]